MKVRDTPERFQVALSFAEGQRDRVRPIASRLEQVLGEGSVFFDEWYPQLAADLMEGGVRGNVYAEKSDLAVVCLSRAYLQEPKTRQAYDAIKAAECRHRQDLRTRGERRGKNVSPVLHLLFETGKYPIPRTDDWPDVRNKAPQKVAGIILSRLKILLRCSEEPMDIEDDAGRSKDAESIQGVDGGVRRGRAMVVDMGVFAFVPEGGSGRAAYQNYARTRRTHEARWWI